jgi:hypothetical protein
MDVHYTVGIDEGINCSLSFGDLAFVSNKLPGGLVSDPIYVGKVIAFSNSTVTIKGPDDGNNGPAFQEVDTFLSFAKDISTNESNLKGYYADVTFTNASTSYAELFAISSEIVPSSK